MNHLLPLILACLLLCGCSRTSLPAALPAPTESVAGLVSEPEEYGGAVQTVPLNLSEVQGLRIFDGRLLLLSGQDSTALTLLETDALTECARAELDIFLEPDDPSLRFHPDGTLSFFDPAAKETLVLDTALEEIRRIPAPGALSGVPILSDDGKTLFYCTASHVRAWNLEDNLHRCVKEMSFDSQSLADVLLEGSVLQCRVTEGDDLHTLFLSAKDGALLYQGSGDFSLETDNGTYYAAIPTGTYRTLVFGTDPKVPVALTPLSFDGEPFFLPGQRAAVTATEQKDQRVQLDYYELSSGLRSCHVTLDRKQLPLAVEYLDKDTLVILTCDPAQLLLWDIRSPLPARDPVCYIDAYHSADDPDAAGLDQCRRQAAALGAQYGINILLWEDAVSAAPWNYDLEPEHLVPILKRELTLLEQRLAQYPQSVLTQTAAHFSTVNLCLVRSVTAASEHPEAAPGVQFLDGADAYVVIPTGTHAEQALYHQLFHLMEIHIFGESKAFDRWEELNPAGFEYDYCYAANAQRDSGVYLFEENRAFADTFSMSYPKEDRARIMECAMLPGNEQLFAPRQMQAKLKRLCEGVREAYGLKGEKEVFLWEQYLE